VARGRADIQLSRNQVNLGVRGRHRANGAKVYAITYTSSWPTDLAALLPHTGCYVRGANLTTVSPCISRSKQVRHTKWTLFGDVLATGRIVDASTMLVHSGHRLIFDGSLLINTSFVIFASTIIVLRRAGVGVSVELIQHMLSKDVVVS